jgi:hypothetical protein
VQFESSGSSHLPSTQADAQYKLQRAFWPLVLSRWFPHQALWLCKWCAVFRSLRAHIRIQFSTETGWVNLGPAFRAQAGRYLPNERTRARAVGTEKLLAMCPWADRADLHAYLMGFEAAEEFCRDQAGHFVDNPESQHRPYRVHLRKGSSFLLRYHSAMKPTPKGPEFTRFTEAMRGIMKVSKTELQRRMEAEKKAQKSTPWEEQARSPMSGPSKSDSR